MPTYKGQLPGPIGITETLTYLRVRNAPGAPLPWHEVGELVAARMRGEPSGRDKAIEDSDLDPEQHERGQCRALCGHVCHVDEIDERTGQCVNCHVE